MIEESSENRQRVTQITPELTHIGGEVSVTSRVSQDMQCFLENGCEK